MDTIEGSEPTLVSTVKEGEVLRVDRSVVSERDGDRWLAFRTGADDRQSDGPASLDNIKWVNWSELKPGTNYEVFDYPNTYANPYRVQGALLDIKDDNGHFPNNIARAEVLPAETFYNHVIDEENLHPHPDIEQTITGMAQKFGK
jgi:hypothetical protein